jgi:hypothetical protein
VPLRNENLTDRELLHIVNDCTAADGYATTREIADRLGRNGEGIHDVASRMNWMVRYEFCTRHADRPGNYKLTAIGRALMDGRLSKGVERALEKMDAGERLLVMRAIAAPTFSAVTPTQDALRREFNHHYVNRKKKGKR